MEYTDKEKDKVRYVDLLKGLFRSTFSNQKHLPKYSHVVNGVWGGLHSREGLSKEKDLLGKLFDPQRFLLNEPCKEVLQLDNTDRAHGYSYEIYSPENEDYSFRQTLEKKLSFPFKKYANHFGNIIPRYEIVKIFKEIYTTEGQNALVVFKDELSAILNEENIRSRRNFFLIRGLGEPAGFSSGDNLANYINIQFGMRNSLFTNYLNNAYPVFLNRSDQRTSGFGDQSSNLILDEEGYYELGGHYSNDISIPVIFAKDKPALRWCMANIAYIPRKEQGKVSIIQFHHQPEIVGGK